MNNIESDLARAPRKCRVPKPGEPWIKNWHNGEIFYYELPQEFHSRWLDETAAWLFSGRRWPVGPSERMVLHCIQWWPRVQRLMERQDFWPELSDHPLTGYTIRWRLRADPDVSLEYSACQAHYAAVVGAILVRRKARFYGLWKEAA